MAETGGPPPRNISPRPPASRKLTRVAERQNQPITRGL